VSLKEIQGDISYYLVTARKPTHVFPPPYPVSLPSALPNTSHPANMWWLLRIYFERALL